MFNLTIVALAVFCVFWMGVAAYQSYMKRAVVRHVNRRLVAYEGKLRELGHEPERVYHDFENGLEGMPSERQAEEFDTETTEGGNNNEN